MSLGWFESFVVVLSLLITLGIGLWFSRLGYVSLQEYMIGGRRMTVLPISLSIAATYLTGSAMVNTSQEVYLYGMQISLGMWLYPFMGIIFAWIYLPVSYSIKSASSFQFFDRRFNRQIRMFASVIYTIETVLHTSMSQYIPAVSLSQATGLPAFHIACVLSLICLAYTASGGLKAVAWADSFQAMLFMFCSFLVVIVGMILIGGPSEIWRKGVEGHRMEFFDFNMSLAQRYNFLNLLTGATILLIHIHLSPSFHQRVVSMPTYEGARQVVIWSSLFAGVFICLMNVTGIIVYAYFAGCDPVLANKGIKSYATILPYFMEQISKTVPGIEGLFLAGVTAAGLSTSTSCWNTVACTIYDDFFAPALGPNVRKKTSFRILMGVVVVISIISTSFILVIENTSSLQEATLTMKSLTISLLFILYNAGMFLPWVSPKGVLTGSLASAALTVYIVIGANYAKKQGLVRNLPKILTTSMCMVNETSNMESLNITTSIGTTGYGMKTAIDPGVPLLSGLSLMLYMFPGAVFGMVVSYLVSLLTGTQDLATVDREMIVPLMRWVLPRPIKEHTNLVTTPLKEYAEVPQEDERETEQAPAR